jgi:hypothetical protein
MARHTYVERTDIQDGAGAGLVITICVVLLIGIVALFMVFGGPGRFIAGPTPPLTDGSAPAQNRAHDGVPRQINITVDAPADAPSQ